MPSCLFCRIASGEIPSHRVYESPEIVAFLDISPIRAGHVQIVPRRHHDYFDDLPTPVANEILALGQRLAPILRQLHGVKKVAFLFTGGDIAHAHAHVVPMVEATDITSRQYIREKEVTFGPAPRADDAELAGEAARIAAALE